MASLFGFGPEEVGNGRSTRRTRTWDDSNGTHWTQEGRSYVGPNIAFFTMNRSTGAPLVEDDVPRTSRARSGSLLGSVLNGLVDYVAPTPQRAEARSHGRSGRRQSSYAEGLAYGDERQQTRRTSALPRSLFSAVAGSLLNTQPARKQDQHRRRQNHSQSPSRHSRRSGPKTRSYNRTALVEDYSSHDESDTLDWSDTDFNDSRSRHADSLSAIAHEIGIHEKEASSARVRLEKACRQRTGNAARLQELAQKVEHHERAKENALRDLEQMRKRAKRRDSGRPRPYRNRSSRHDSVTEEFGNDPFFNDPLFGDFTPQPPQHQTAHPLFAEMRNAHPSPQFDGSPFAAFENFFADFERMNNVHHNMHQQFFSVPGATFATSFGAQPQARWFSTNTNGGPQFQGPHFQQQQQQQQQTSFTTFTPQPRAPPSTILKQEEIQRLFKTYIDRWSSLAPSDSNIPFPARGLKSANLGARNTLWAPTVSSPVESWSEETVMKANTHAFFLGAVGLRPAYLEMAGAKIELGIDKTSASPAQLQQLIDVLKKERARWHSDRLGKRNGGRAGPNEALQGDERARAVYHGVCELIQAAQ